MAEATPTEKPNPDTESAVQFLKQFAPNGTWVLNAIRPDRNGVTTDTFRPETEDQMRGWLKQYNGAHNIYFQVNPPIRDLSKKASKEDVQSLEWLHVDIDPRAGEDIAEEQERIRTLLLENRPEGVPQPTCIIFSGGGYQAFWRLEQPIPIDGDLGRAAEAERYNRKLETLFGADSCHNVDRIMRVPGTINIPDAKKRKRGRVETLAELIFFDESRTYPIDQFSPAPVVRPDETGLEGPNIIALYGNAKRVADLSELDRWGVPDRVKVVIAQGKHPDEPKPGDDSRSAWLFDVVCNMLRCDVPPEVVFSIITDPDWPISESVLELNDGAENYARRQIEKAREKVGEDLIDFQVNKDGVPYPSQHNIRVALHKLGIRLSHDQFADRLLIEGLTGHGPTLQDEAVARLWLGIDERFGFRPGKEFFWMVVEDEARQHGHHPVRDYLDGLVWDGVARVDEWLVQFGGADDTPYVRAVGGLFLVAAVRRIRQPGCKFDEMLVLRSPQGNDKSSALAALVPVADWFTDDLPLGADTKVIIERLHGRWVVEAAELKGMRGGEVEHLKAFLSRQVDRARMAYGRITKEVPRQCVIAGTTNSERFLKDTTGNRRFWPVAVGKFDAAGVRRDRDQLWAEAVYREAAGESIRLDPALYPAAADAQEAHRVEDPFAVELERVLGSIEGKLLAADIWDLFGIPAGLRTQDHNARLGEAMRELGWKRKKLRFGGGIPAWCYVRGEGRERIMVYRDAQGVASAEHERPPVPF